MKKNSSENIVAIELPNKIVTLNVADFDTDIDTQELTQIAHHNLIGEILTSSALLNKVGNLKADLENIVAEAKLDFEIFAAQTKEKKRKDLTFETLDSKNNPKVSKPTADEVENAYLMTPEYKVKKKKILELQKNLSYIDSLYWAVRSKDEKIIKLSEKLRPEEFEKDIVEERINGMMIKSHKKAII